MPLIVKLQQLDIKETREFSLTGEELELVGLKLKDDVKAQLDIFKGNNIVRIQGTVGAIVLMSCSRCLEIFELIISERFKLDYILGKDPYQRMDNIELKKEDIDRVYFQGESIDIAIGIRDAICLAIPISPICKELCAGLCPSCGKNLNKGKCECT